VLVHLQECAHEQLSCNQCTRHYMLHVECVAAWLLFQDVTSYIQCRGRARKRGSRYCFMQGTESPHSIQHIIL